VANSQGSSLGSYVMHQIGPQHVRESYVGHFADLNRDGHLDLLVGGRAPFEGFRIEWGTGDGNWRMQTGPDTSMVPRAFSAMDTDFDGIDEILVCGQGDQKGLQVWTMDDASRFQLHSSPIESGHFLDAVFVDVNNDGWVDIVAARADPEPDGGIYVWLNNGNGGWVADIGPMSEGVFTDISVIDLNRDGEMDIVASRRGGMGGKRRLGERWESVGGVQIWYGNQGRWQQHVLSTEADVESVTVADLNGDGRLDIAAGLYQKGIRVWLAMENSWRAIRSPVSTGTWNHLRIGDLDGDQRLELVAASGEGAGLGIWRWQGRYLNRVRGLVPDHGIYLNVSLGDVYGDGRLAIAASRKSGGIEVWSSEAAKAPVATTFKQPVGTPLQLFFDSGSATLDMHSKHALLSWYQALPDEKKRIHLRVEGRADSRVIHSEVFPNNLALSRARADAVVAELREQSIPVKQVTIVAVGDSKPDPDGNSEPVLRKNRLVLINAYLFASVSLPGEQVEEVLEQSDLFHVDENRIFKTIDGLPEYRVGHGDELKVTIWKGGLPTIHKVVVQIDGSISLPYQASFPVNAATPREIDARLTKLLAKYEHRPRVDVEVIKAMSKTATIFGEVQNLTRQPTGPGTYFMKGKETIVDFLSRAGGPTKDANLAKVQVLRDGKTITLDLNRAIKQGDWTENAILDDSDTIFIPSLSHSKQQVYVIGEVGKPGIVGFADDINVLEAISQSGGFSDDAYLADMRIIRADRDAPQILAVAFDRFMEKGDLSQNLGLRNRDVLIVPRRPIANWNQWLNDMTPVLNLLLMPLNIANQVISVRELSQSLSDGN
ncbi:MAG: FG-GAP-like repeat-containing protein, partial [Mariprofundaceae bacterium]